MSCLGSGWAGAGLLSSGAAELSLEGRGWTAAAITDYQTSGLKQQEFVILLFWGSQADVGLTGQVTGPGSLLEAPGQNPVPHVVGPRSLPLAVVGWGLLPAS